MRFTNTVGALSIMQTQTSGPTRYLSKLFSLQMAASTAFKVYRKPIHCQPQILNQHCPCYRHIHHRQINHLVNLFAQKRSIFLWHDVSRCSMTGLKINAITNNATLFILVLIWAILVMVRLKNLFCSW